MYKANFHSKSSELIVGAEVDAFSNIRLIASESLLSPAIARALSTPLHSVTVEGQLYQRYLGCDEKFNLIEEKAEFLFTQLLKKKHANLQPHSASIANYAAILGLTKPGDVILAMSMNHGGHLSHGGKSSQSFKRNKIITYRTEDDGNIDYEAITSLAKRYQPQLIISGTSSYPRWIDHDQISAISHKVGSIHLVDIAHTVGFHVAGLTNQNFNEADLISLSTQKTLLGPRGGAILSNNKELINRVSHAVFPGLQGALHTHSIVAKLLCAEFAGTYKFKDLMLHCSRLASIFADCLKNNGLTLWTGGTDKHLIMIDLRAFEVDARDVELTLKKNGFVCNANIMPGDIHQRSGLRIGLLGLAQLNYCEDEIREIANLFSELILHIIDELHWKPSNKTKSKISEIVNIYHKRVFDFMRWAGTELYDDYVDSPDQSVYKSVIFSGTKQNQRIKSPQIEIVSSQAINVKLLDPKPTVVLPAREVNDTLETVLHYTRNWCVNANIIVVSSKPPNSLVKNICRSYDAILVDSLSLVDKVLTVSNLEQMLSCNLKQGKGKGLDVFAGLLLGHYLGAKGFYLMDTDLSSFEQYQPLHSLSAISADHVCIATPGRKNDAIHSLIDNLDVFSILCSDKNYLDRIQKVLREYVHFLAGERYLSDRLVYRLPIASGYGFETVLAFFSSQVDFRTVQVGNHYRPDNRNYRQKNESIITNAMRLLLALSVHSIPLWDWSFKNYVEFNSKYLRFSENTILPQCPGMPVMRFKLRRDVLLPSIQMLYENEYINNDLMYEWTSQIMEDCGCEWRT